MLEIDTKKIEDIIRHVAATEVMPRFKNLAAGDIREKNPGDFVTVADEASEKLFTKLLAEALPGSLVVGEEAVSKDLNVLKKFAEGKPVWVIDPIDGTYNFSHNRSQFGILIALVQDGVTQYGWAYDVPGDRMVSAKKGAGAFMDGKRLKIECKKTDMKEMIAQAGGAQAWHFEPVSPFFKEVLNFRCALHDFMNFVTGGSDFVVHVNKATPWDHAANVLIAQEAGAYVVMNDNEEYDPACYGPAFILAAPSKEWWEKLFPVLYPRVQKKQPAA